MSRFSAQGVGSEVQHGRGDLADIDDVDARRDKPAHQGRAQRRAVQAAVAADGALSPSASAIVPKAAQGLGGVSDRHVRRLFGAQFGVSPVQYLQTRRRLTPKQLLADTDLAVTQVALISGYASVRRFNAAFLEHYGLNPTQLRREGSARPDQGIAVKLGYRPPYDVDAMLGFFRTRKADRKDFFHRIRWQDALLQAVTQLREYFAGRRSAFELPLDLQGGTVFQQSVWQALLNIPSGATASYGAVSDRLGKPAAVRAVGAAVGRNPLSIVVPCHRVLGADGSLTGYAGGLERKTALLRLEGVFDLISASNPAENFMDGSPALRFRPTLQAHDSCHRHRLHLALRHLVLPVHAHRHGGVLPNRSPT